MTKTAAILVEHLRFSYEPEREVLAIEHWQVEQGDFMALVGPNGGGKTTLLRLLLGFERPQQGRIQLLGAAPGRSRHRVGYIPQRDAIDAQAPHTVLDVVLSGRLRGSSWGFRYAKQDRDAAAQALERVGLSDCAQRPLRALSGGQRQRIRLARALAAEAELLLLDEPMTGVDPASEEQLLELLHELGRSRTIVMVSHDIACVSQHVRHVACCNHGISTHRVEDMTPERLLQSYRPGSRALAHDPSSCPFHPPREQVS